MTTPYEDWQMDARYNFTTVAPAILQASYTSIKLTTEGVNFDIAKLIGSINIYAQWRQVYPLLPPGTPDTPESARWLVFETNDGQNVVLAENWINGASVVPVEFKQFDIAITQSNYPQMERIRSFLSKIGAKFTITERL